MTTSYIDQIKELEAQKQKLLQKAKAEALGQAQRAVTELNNLGFNYRLVEGQTSSSVTGTPTRTRKSGVSNDVLAVIKKAPNGLPRAGVLEQMGATDKKQEQSISNSLTNLKKKGLLTAEDGIYKAT